MVSRELGLPAARLTTWREAFLGAGQDALKNPPLDNHDRELARLRQKLGDATMELELLHEKLGRLATDRPRAGSSSSAGCPSPATRPVRALRRGACGRTPCWGRWQRPFDFPILCTTETFIVGDILWRLASFQPLGKPALRPMCGSSTICLIASLRGSQTTTLCNRGGGFP